MIETDWKRLKHFHAWENWGDWEKLDVRLLLELDKLRSFLNKKIIVTCATQGVHTEKSFHYEGRAVDIVIPEPGYLSLLDLFIAVSRFDFHGIGLYLNWTYNEKRVPGLHLDQRQFSPNWTGNHRAHWLCVEINAKNSYLPIKEDTLKKYNVL